ncbi:MAG: hypothetical protein OEM97_08380 [Acidimicrobiia bacterium]|nr:hypothetical protein [Acidimicrobiia bacterium]
MRLEVDAFVNESGGVGPAEIMELEPVEACLGSGRVTDPVEPVRVVQMLTVRRADDEGLAVFWAEASSV